jgi:hypothetical protein
MQFNTIGCRYDLICLAAIAAAWSSCSLAQEVKTRSFLLSTRAAFEDGQGAWGVRLDEEGTVMLYDRVLVEDDGPGIGSDAPWMKSGRAPTLDIGGSTRIKKVLHVERLGALDARLYVPEGVAVEINGRPMTVEAGTPFPQVAVSLLRQGDNEVVLSCPASAPRSIKIALPEDILRNAPDRKDRPGRSFKSTDGGKTWQPIRGEFMVRLHLVQHVPEGQLISPVMDLGQEWAANHPILKPVSIESVALAAGATVPPGTSVDLAIRTGPSPVYEESLWSAWQPARRFVWLAIPRGHRYWQWKADLTSSDPAETPLLRDVGVEAKGVQLPAPAWAAGLRVVASHNEEIRYTSLPFEYEDPLHPRMVALRQKHKLDAVVSPGKTETERLVRLRDWIAHQWKYQPPERDYPAWDADEILRRKYGFCVQYAITLMQSAISLGHQARFVFGNNPGAFDGGGHEVVEIWSNEHRKWIFFDSHQNWHYVDPKTNVPMSMLEVHDLVVKTYYGGRPAALDNPPQKRQPSDALAICYRTEMTPGIPPEDQAWQLIGGRYTVPTRWLFVRYMPRNNFYAKPYPQPKTQGCHWDWSDYWCWEDAATPKQPLYRNFTARRNDLDWTINQVCFDATITDRPGTLAIQMGTFTPYFDTFLVKVDAQAWKASPRAFPWQLHPGHNRVEMRVRNKAGVDGPVSFLEVDEKENGRM